LAAAIKAAKHVDVDLEVGSGGVFEVFKDDAIVFSKKKLGRFPDTDGEVIDAL
jgi:predicted Rdx family selenoprotein